jgi:hypothetical protein
VTVRIENDAGYWRQKYEEQLALQEDGFTTLLEDRDGWKRDALRYLAERDDARTAARRYQAMAERLLADLDAVRRNIERFEQDLPPVEDFQVVVTADGLQMLGWARVLCETALEDYAGTSFPHVEPAAAPSRSGASEQVDQAAAPSSKNRPSTAAPKGAASAAPPCGRRPTT